MIFFRILQWQIKYFKVIKYKKIIKNNYDLYLEYYNDSLIV